MPKFSDSSYKILKDYFDVIKAERTDDDDSYILGQKRTIVSEGGIYTKLYQENEAGDFIGHRFIIQSITGNNFRFEYVGLESQHSGATELAVGERMWFRKDSFFHDWLLNNPTASVEFEDFINTNKSFIYFGDILQISNSTDYNIEFNGLKDWTMNALPEHNRTDNLTDFMEVYWDRVYHQIYNLTKTLWSMIDPKEVKIEHLDYLATRMNIATDKDKVGGLILREWVDQLIYWLKRKGGYTSWIAVYKMILGGTRNKLNIFEKWCEWCLFELRKPENWLLDRDFDEHHVLEYYLPSAGLPSGGAGPEYYSKYQIADYPVHASTAPAASGCTATRYICGDLNDIDTWASIVDEQGITQVSDYSVLIDNYDASNIGDVAVYGSATVTGGSPVSGASSQEVRNCLRVMMDSTSAPSGGIMVWAASDTEAEELSSGERGANRNWVGLSYELLGRLDAGTIPVFKLIQQVPSASFINTSTAGFATDETYYIVVEKKNDILTANFYENPSHKSTEIVEQLSLNLKGDAVGKDSWNTIYTVANRRSASVMPSSSFYGEVSFLRQSAGEVQTLGTTGTKVITPHIRVELDLSTEPMGADYIISQDQADELVRYWEYLKPVSKFVEYNWLLSPIGKIDDNSEAINLYNVDDTAFCITQFVGQELVSAGVPSSGSLGPDNDYYENTYKENRLISTDKWSIFHGLDSSELIIQTYDKDDYQIWPINHIFLNENRVEIDWAGNKRGKALIAGLKSWNHSHFQSEPASAWNITHNQGISGANGVAFEIVSVSGSQSVALDSMVVQDTHFDIGPIENWKRYFGPSAWSVSGGWTYDSDKDIYEVATLDDRSYAVLEPVGDWEDDFRRERIRLTFTTSAGITPSGSWILNGNPSNVNFGSVTIIDDDEYQQLDTRDQAAAGAQTPVLTINGSDYYISDDSSGDGDSVWYAVNNNPTNPGYTTSFAGAPSQFSSIGPHELITQGNASVSGGIALRFEGIALDQGETISSASLKLYATNAAAKTGPAYVQIRARDVAKGERSLTGVGGGGTSSGEDFFHQICYGYVGDQGVHYLPYGINGPGGLNIPPSGGTDATVNWTFQSDSGYDQNGYNTSPDISAVIQEVVDRADWAGNPNTMTLYIYARAQGELEAEVVSAATRWDQIAVSETPANSGRVVFTPDFTDWWYDRPGDINNLRFQLLSGSVNTSGSSGADYYFAELGQNRNFGVNTIEGYFDNILETNNFISPLSGSDGISTTYSYIPSATTVSAGSLDYYFTNDFDSLNWTNTANAVDGSIATLATAPSLNISSLGVNNGLDTYTASGNKTIDKVFYRVYGDNDLGAGCDTFPIFKAGNGNTRNIDGLSSEWSSWFNITDDTNAPDEWDWDDFKQLGVWFLTDFQGAGETYDVMKVETRADYTAELGRPGDPPTSASYITDGNTISTAASSSINIVEIRLKKEGQPAGAFLRPVFDSTQFGDSIDISDVDGWSNWFDITNDSEAPNPWLWSDIYSLGSALHSPDVTAGTIFKLFDTEIRVTEDNTDNIIDSINTTFSSAASANAYIFVSGATVSAGDLEQDITKVWIRAHAKRTGGDLVELIPYFDTVSGAKIDITSNVVTAGSDYTPWFRIDNDPNAYSPWTPSDFDTFGIGVHFDAGEDGILAISEVNAKAEKWYTDRTLTTDDYQLRNIEFWDNTVSAGRITFESMPRKAESYVSLGQRGLQPNFEFWFDYEITSAGIGVDNRGGEVALLTVSDAEIDDVRDLSRLPSGAYAISMRAVNISAGMYMLLSDFSPSGDENTTEWNIGETAYGTSNSTDQLYVKFNRYTSYGTSSQPAIVARYYLNDDRLPEDLLYTQTHYLDWAGSLIVNDYTYILNAAGEIPSGTPGLLPSGSFIYNFDEYDDSTHGVEHTQFADEWETTPANMVDGSLSTFAQEEESNAWQILSVSPLTASGSADPGTLISNVKIRAHGLAGGPARSWDLQPVFNNTPTSATYYYDTYRAGFDSTSDRAIDGLETTFASAWGGTTDEQEIVFISHTASGNTPLTGEISKVEVRFFGSYGLEDPDNLYFEAFFDGTQVGNSQWGITGEWNNSGDSWSDWTNISEEVPGPGWSSKDGYSTSQKGIGWTWDDFLNLDFKLTYDGNNEVGFAENWVRVARAEVRVVMGGEYYRLRDANIPLSDVMIIASGGSGLWPTRGIKPGKPNIGVGYGGPDFYFCAFDGDGNFWTAHRSSDYLNHINTFDRSVQTGVIHKHFGRSSLIDKIYEPSGAAGGTGSDFADKHKATNSTNDPWRGGGLFYNENTGRMGHSMGHPDTNVLRILEFSETAVDYPNQMTYEKDLTVNGFSYSGFESVTGITYDPVNDNYIFTYNEKLYVVDGTSGNILRQRAIRLFDGGYFMSWGLDVSGGVLFQPCEGFNPDIPYVYALDPLTLTASTTVQPSAVELTYEGAGALYGGMAADKTTGNWYYGSATGNRWRASRKWSSDALPANSLADYSSWVDVTNDPNAPSTWTVADVNALQVRNIFLENEDNERLSTNVNYVRTTQIEVMAEFAASATAPATSGSTRISGYIHNHSQVYDNPPVLVMPARAQQVTPNDLKLTFAEPLDGKCFIRDDDYFHTQSTASTSWVINHNLNSFGQIVHCYDHDNNWVFPDEIQLTSRNVTVATFAEPVSGTAVLITYASDIDRNGTTQLFGDTNLGIKGFWKIGEGGDNPYFDPQKANNINTILTSGGLSSFTETSTAASGKLLINFEVPKATAYTVNELGVFDSNNDLHYYTRCSTLHKPDDIELHVKYRIDKE